MDSQFNQAKQSFDQLSFTDRMGSVFQLFANTFTVIGRDADILKPLYRMIAYNFIMVSAFFYALFGIWYDLPFQVMMFLIGFLFFSYKYFYYSRQETRMSWIIYQSITGNEPTYKDSVNASKELKSQIRKIAWIDIVMAFMMKRKNTGEGVLNTIIRFFIKGLNEVWDLVNHYLIPSVAIDKLDLKPAIENMKTLKDRVPETLLGVFGIDFLGKVVTKVVAPVYTVLILLSIAAGIFFHEYMPSYELSLNGGELPIDSFQFTWIPLLAAIWIGKLFSSYFERMVTTVKVIYFTIFYTKITHPEEIADDLQEDLNDYLRLNNVDKVDNLDEQETE